MFDKAHPSTLDYGSKGPDDAPPNGPMWSIEGIAMLIEFQVSDKFGIQPFAQGRARTVAGDKQYANLTLKDLQTHNDRAKGPGAAYVTGLLGAEFLAQKSGSPPAANGVSPAFAKYYEDIGKGMPWQKAFQDNFKITPDDFYTQFEQYRKTIQ